MNGWLRLAHSLLQGRRCAPDRSCRQGRAWLCRARGAGSDGDVGRCVPLPPLRPQNARLYEFSIKPTVCLSRSSSRPALTGSGSNCTCHADTTGLKQGTLGRDARDCWDPQSSFTARGAPRRRALGWPDWPPRSPAAAVRRRRAELKCVPARAGRGTKDRIRRVGPGRGTKGRTRRAGTGRGTKERMRRAGTGRGTRERMRRAVVQMGRASGQTRTSGRVGKRAGCFAVEFLLHHLYRRYARGS